MVPGTPFHNQVAFLVQLLPIVARQGCFALKGGTAINLFVRDLPRLSVDIDLAYLPMVGREQALQEINAALCAIARESERRLPGCRVHLQVNRDTGTHLKLIASRDELLVKIEVTPVMRGSVFEAVWSSVRPLVADQFGYAEMRVLNFKDLYAGKLCATLDRQHPRDLFDTRMLLENEGIDRDLMRAFLVYLICHNRPMADLLAPKAKRVDEAYVAEFEGMTAEPVKLSWLEQTLPRLVAALHAALTDADREFLVSVKRGDPEWNHLGIAHVADLPAVRWKLLNLDRMDHRKRAAAIGNLEQVLSVDGDA